MKLYHGTSKKRWDMIQKTGLVPRGKSKFSNWSHSIESNPDTIYLTDAYAMYFGLSAIEKVGEHMDDVVLIEIEIDGLPGIMVPDEDALEQVSRRQNDGLPTHWDMVRRTRHYRAMTQTYAEAGLDYVWSLSQLGTCGHVGTIAPEHFHRVAVIDVEKAKELSWAYMDISLTVINYQILGARWREITNMIFNPDQRRHTKIKEPIILPLPKVGPGIKLINLK